MPKFHYKARARGGALVRGTIEAADPWLARKALLAQKLIVIEINRFSIDTVLSFLKGARESIGKKVSLDDKLLLVNQVQTGVSIGMPIVQLLESVGQQFKNPYVKAALIDVAKDVGQGSTLHQACAKHPKVFDDLAVALIRTGEVTGELEVTLGRLAEIIEQQVKNRIKVKSATFYPKIVLSFMAIVVLILVYFVIPKFKTFLATLGQGLPLITQIVVNTSDFFVHYWYLLLMIGFGAFYAFRGYVATERGRLSFDRLKLKVPLLGRLFMELELNNFCIILDLLIASGQPLFEAFTTLRETQNNQIVKNEIDRCSAEVSSGSSFGAALGSSSLLPPTFVSMITLGEESGKLSFVLQKLGKYYQIQVDYRLDNLAKLIEPILLVFLFFMVGTVALAVYLPIWKMSASVH